MSRETIADVVLPMLPLSFKNRERYSVSVSPTLRRKWWRRARATARQSLQRFTGFFSEARRVQ